MKNLIMLPFLLSGFNTQPNNANNTSFNVNPTITALGGDMENIDNDYYSQNILYSLSYSNNIFNINGNANIQSKYDFEDEYIWIKTNSGSGHFTSLLYYFEIDSTKYIENAELDLDLYISMQSAGTTHILRLNYITWHSTSSIVGNYMQQQTNNYSNPQFNYNLIQTLVNGNLTTAFTTTNGTQINVHEHTTANLTTTYNLVSGLTNYVLVYIEPYIRINTTTPTQYPYENDTSQEWANITNVSNMISLNGQYNNDVINQEVVDIPGMMFEILTMPFTFISMAFNLTLFPGTQYMLNISNLFLTIIGILIFVWILKKLVFKS